MGDYMSVRTTIILILLAIAGQPAGAQTLQLITEDNPPFNYTEGSTGVLKGAAHELVVALMAEAEVPFTTTLLPWHRGYRRALENPNSCIYGINRTHDREELFEWIGPLFESGWAFYSYDKTIKLHSLTDIEDQIVVVKSGDAVANAFAAARPDARVLTVETDRVGVRLLERGRADLWLTGIVHVGKSAELEGLPVPELKLMWRKSVVYMACAKGTDVAALAKLRSAMPVLDGLREKVIAKYW